MAHDVSRHVLLIIYNCKHKFLPVKEVLEIIRTRLITSIAIMPLFHQWAHLAWQVDTIIKAFFFLEAHMTP